MAVDYVRETGIQGVSLDTGMSLEWARDNLQPEVCVQGNLDPLLLVAGGGEMRRGVAHIFEMIGKKPFIFNLGHGIVPQTPPEHVTELVELVRSYQR
jgi:uroporphyrinogen decarboxylase